MPSSFPSPILYSPCQHAHLLPSIYKLHKACVQHDGMLARFLDISNESKVMAYWNLKNSEVLAGTRLIVFQLSSNECGGDEELAGVVMLQMPESETGPFRAEVEQLMVSPAFRHRGIARRIMEKLEQEAKERGRGLLMLDTTIGSGAEFVYPKLGYKPIGVIPRYGISPRDGELRDEMFFYKDLREKR